MSATPAVVIETLLAAPRASAGLVLRPFTLHAQLLLERVGHPILSETKPKLSSFQNAELVYVLAADPEEASSAALAGELEWKMEVLHFSERVPPAQFAECVRVAIAQIHAAFAPASSFAEKKSP